MSKMSLLRMLMLTAVFCQVASRVALPNVSRIIENNGSVVVMVNGNFSKQNHNDGWNDHDVNATNKPLKSMNSVFVGSDGKEPVDADLTASASDTTTVVPCKTIVNFTAEPYELCELFIVIASAVTVVVVFGITCFLHYFRTFTKIRVHDTKEGKKGKNVDKVKYSLDEVMESETGDVTKVAVIHLDLRKLEVQVFSAH
ncbi:hypothetical protein T4D_12005 [Trichinella pseudospiralis]|uniref:Uncharacterized protein n=1 Tax=Trichinella pseudospiralis TaxID=6337 RepID=A0A0V1FGS5_TRIPS|nr:hypothetical protein T4D_12005 [Trichinella pseudospiralis]